MDWSKLKPYKSNKNKSFEQLCYQIACTLYENQGEFWPIDDSGGGDGVEFFIELKSGMEWGWQAKFYDGSIRLKESGRKTKIKESLKKALTEHPKMTKWFLCTNSDLTPDERKWFTEDLVNEIPEDRNVKLIHWGSTKIHRYLNRPLFYGLKQSFFNELELDDSWFHSTFMKFFKIVENKFNSDLHTEDSNLMYDHINPLFSDKEFKDRLNEYLQNIIENQIELQNEVNQIEKLNLNDFDWKSVSLDYITEYRYFLSISKLLIDKIQKLFDLVCPNKILSFIETDSEELLKPLIQKIKTAGQIRESIKIEFRKDYKKKEYGNDDHRLEHVYRTIRAPQSSASIICDGITDIFEHALLTRKKAFHILGEGGIGKTHLTTNIAKKHIDKGFPAIFIPAIKFNNSKNIEAQILELLDISSNYSFDQFLQTLNAIGKTYNKRLPIIFDGLNESIDSNGMHNKRWRIDLDGIEEQICKFSNLVLITSCRPSYKNLIWKESNSNLHEYYGFSNEEDIRTLVERYFKTYKIKSDLTYLSFQQFRKPLYVTIFCETKNPNKVKQIQVTLGKDSIFDIFEAFIQKCNSSIFNRLTDDFDLPPNSKIKTVASVSLEQMAKSLWENNSRFILRDDFYDMIDGTNRDYHKSKTKALEDEGLLIIRDWFGEDEHIGFTYDLLGGFIIAKYLTSIIEDPKLFLEDEKNYKRLLPISRLNEDKMHPLHEDILECLAALLPMSGKGHLYEFLSKEKKFQKALDVSIQTLFALSSNYISYKEIQFVQKLLIYEKNRRYLIRDSEEVFFVNDHPFNMNFWSSELQKINMIQRDLMWSENLREKGPNHFEELLKQFNKDLEFHKTKSLLELERTHLVATYLAWSLSTTIQLNRNRFSKSLYWYGRYFTTEFLSLLSSTLNSNDVYINQRMLACCYGIVLARKNELESDEFRTNILPTIARLLYDKIFGPKCVHPISHILSKEYTLSIIEIAIKYHPKLFSQNELDDMAPPFKNRAIKRWGTSIDKNEEDYREGNSPIDYEFEKHKMFYLTSDGNQYNPSKKYMKILGQLHWRLYKLGYDFSIFERIDKSISSVKYYQDEYWSSSWRYGQKYLNIAYYEVANHLNSNNQINKLYELNNSRFSDQDIDPSFFEEVETHSLFTEDFTLGDHETIEDWLDDPQRSDISARLIVSDVNNHKGEWVLIGGSLDQLDKEKGRKIAICPNAIFCKNDESTIDALANNIQLGYVETPKMRNVFIDEFGDSDYHNDYGFNVIEYETGKTSLQEIEYYEYKLFNSEKQLSDREVRTFWSELEVKYNVTITLSPPTKGNPPHFPYSVINFSDSEFDIEKELISHGLEYKLIKFKKKEKIMETKEFEYFIPQIETEKGLVLAKEICIEFNLISIPQSSNLSESNGNIASLYFSDGGGYTNQQNFHFIRKDLLDIYLKKNNLKMFWNIWGEKSYQPENLRLRENIRREVFEPYVQIVVYPSPEVVNKYNPD